jgi:hypothetical protein
MLAYNKASGLYKEWENDDWKSTIHENPELGTMYITLKLMMDDMYRCVKEYSRVKTQTNLHRLITKYKKTKEYYDNYKYKSMLAGMSNGSTIK